MNIRTRLKRLEGSASGCECDKIEITLDLDAAEAARRYKQIISCRAHTSAAPEISILTPEQATEKYEKHFKRC